MNKALEIKREFLEALRERNGEYGRGFQTFLATDIGKTKGAFTSIFKYFKNEIELEKVKLSFELQVEIAEACEADYIDFVQKGRDLLYGKKSNTVISIGSITEKHYEIIKKFKDKKTALDANKKLVKIEAGNSVEYGRVLERIDIAADKIDKETTAPTPTPKTGTKGG